MGGRVGRLICNRRYHFQSVHSLRTHLEKRHGHSYALEVSFSEGLDWKQVDICVHNHILSVLHAREITMIEPATGENIVNWIHTELLKTELGPCLVGVALQETHKNRFISEATDLKYV